MRQGPNEKGRRRAPRLSRCGGRRPFVALLALAGILLHAFLPFFPMSVPAAASPFGASLTICTAMGVVVIPSGGVDGGTSDETTPPSRSILLCPVCVVAHLAAFLPPAVSVHTPAAMAPAAWIASEAIGPFRRAAGYDSLPRAPPASV